MQSEIMNKSGQMNYIAENKIFILDHIKRETTAELIGNLSTLVDHLPWGPVYQGTKATITNPYKLDRRTIKNPIIDIFINSPGGQLDQTKAIMTLLNLARAKGAIIRTTNMGMAASCASLIAIQGTPNFRIMYDQAYNLIHYGKSTMSVDRIHDVEKAAEYEKELRESFMAPYLSRTNLTPDELTELQRTEQGYLNAQKCLQKNICDWVLTTDGKIIGR